MKLILAIAVLATSLSASAFDVSSDKAERIAKVLGVERMLDESRRWGVETNQQQVKMLLQELRNAGTSDAVLDTLGQAVEVVMKNIEASWDSKEAARLYCEELLDTLTDEELDQAEKYYGSATGQKTYSAISAGQNKMMAYISSRMNAATEQEMGKLVELIKQAKAQR